MFDVIQINILPNYYLLGLVIWRLQLTIANTVLIHVDCDEMSSDKRNVFPHFKEIELRN